MVHDIKNRKEKKKMKLHVAWCWTQPTIRYFHLAQLTESSYQKAEKKKIVKRKNKRTERDADLRYVEGVLDVEWEKVGESEKKN